jgi:diacylglycerol kinase (ATP)
MKQVILLHNPSAGDEDHLKEELVKAIENEGFGCTYFSIREESWKQQLDNADFAVVGGGDGTVRRVVKELVKRDVLAKRLPIALLPMGTANNLSKTLGIDRDADKETHIRNWKNERLQKFDVGVVKNADAIEFFIESVGFGVFPKLIKEMRTVDKTRVDSAKAEIKLALEVLYDLIQSAEAERCWIKADDDIYEGDYLMVEVMNSSSIGPNLVLAPDAKTDDAVFDIVLLEKGQREEFAAYIKDLIDDKDKVPAFAMKTIKAKELIVANHSKYMHIDDELIIPMKNPLTIEIREKILEFIV